MLLFVFCFVREGQIKSCCLQQKGTTPPKLQLGEKPRYLITCVGGAALLGSSVAASIDPGTCIQSAGAHALHFYVLLEMRTQAAMQSRRHNHDVLTALA